MGGQDRFITTKEREITQYRENELLTREFVSQKINEINGDVENMRYIRLTKKHNIDDMFSPYIEYIFNMKQ